MSDHIPDPTKMISDTPRTDDAEYLSYDSEPPESLEMVDVDFARTLERELNSANQIIRQQQLLEEENLRLQERIKRLEEACREMVSEEDTYIRLQIWLKAKEAKL
jgi:hypothetical protein